MTGGAIQRDRYIGHATESLSSLPVDPHQFILLQDVGCTPASGVRQDDRVVGIQGKPGQASRVVAGATD